MSQLNVGSLEEYQNNRAQIEKAKQLLESYAAMNEEARAKWEYEQDLARKVAEGERARQELARLKARNALAIAAPPAPAPPPLPQIAITPQHQAYAQPAARIEEVSGHTGYNDQRNVYPSLFRNQGQTAEWRVQPQEQFQQSIFASQDPPSEIDSAYRYYHSHASQHGGYQAQFQAQGPPPAMPSYVRASHQVPPVAQVQRPQQIFMEEQQPLQQRPPSQAQQRPQTHTSNVHRGAAAAHPTSQQFGVAHQDHSRNQGAAAAQPAAQQVDVAHQDHLRHQGTAAAQPASQQVDVAHQDHSRHQGTAAAQPASQQVGVAHQDYSRHQRVAAAQPVSQQVDVAHQDYSRHALQQDVAHQDYSRHQGTAAAQPTSQQVDVALQDHPRYSVFSTNQPKASLNPTSYHQTNAMSSSVPKSSSLIGALEHGSSVRPEIQKGAATNMVPPISTIPKPRAPNFSHLILYKPDSDVLLRPFSNNRDLLWYLRASYPKWASEMPPNSYYLIPGTTYAICRTTDGAILLTHPSADGKGGFSFWDLKTTIDANKHLFSVEPPKRIPKTVEPPNAQTTTSDSSTQRPMPLRVTTTQSNNPPVPHATAELPEVISLVSPTSPVREQQTLPSETRLHQAEAHIRPPIIKRTPADVDKRFLARDILRALGVKRHLTESPSSQSMERPAKRHMAEPGGGIAPISTPMASSQVVEPSLALSSPPDISHPTAVFSAEAPMVRSWPSPVSTSPRIVELPTEPDLTQALPPSTAATSPRIVELPAEPDLMQGVDDVVARITEQSSALNTTTAVPSADVPMTTSPSTLSTSARVVELPTEPDAKQVPMERSPQMMSTSARVVELPTEPDAKQVPMERSPQMMSTSPRIVEFPTEPEPKQVPMARSPPTMSISPPIVELPTEPDSRQRVGDVVTGIVEESPILDTTTPMEVDMDPKSTLTSAQDEPMVEHASVFGPQSADDAANKLNDLSIQEQGLNMEGERVQVEVPMRKADESISLIHGDGGKDDAKRPSHIVLTPPPITKLAIKTPLFLPSPSSSAYGGDSPRLSYPSPDSSSLNENVSTTDVMHDQPSIMKRQARQPRVPSRTGFYILVPPPPPYLRKYREQEARRKKERKLRAQRADRGSGYTRSSSEENTHDLRTDLAIKTSASRLSERRCKWGSCDAILNSSENLFEHLRRNHSTNDTSKPYILCNWTGCADHVGNSQIEEHLASHSFSSLLCPHEDCDESFRVVHSLVKHWVKHNSLEKLKGTPQPFSPQIQEPPPIPGKVPDYLIKSGLVRQEAISNDRHQLLGKWVFNNIAGPVKVTKRYNAAKNKPAGYEFLLSSSMQFSTNPSQPAKVRDIGDLHSVEVSEMISEGLFYWPPPKTAETEARSSSEDELAMEPRKPSPTKMTVELPFVSRQSSEDEAVEKMLTTQSYGSS